MSIFKKTEKKQGVRKLGAVDTSAAQLSAFGTSKGWEKLMPRVAAQINADRDRLAASQKRATRNLFQDLAFDVRSRKASYEQMPDSMNVATPGDFSEMARHYALQAPTDRAATFMRTASENRFKRNASHLLTMGEVRAWEKSARALNPKSAAVEAIMTDGLAQVASLPDQYNFLNRRASLVTDQASFEKVAGELGLTSNTLEHRFARAYLAKAAESQAARKKTAKRKVAQEEVVKEFDYQGKWVVILKDSDGLFAATVDGDEVCTNEESARSAASVARDFIEGKHEGKQAQKSDEDIRLELISTYSAVGDDPEERRHDLEKYEEQIREMSATELEVHYNDTFGHSGKQAQMANDPLLKACFEHFPGFADDTDVNAADLVDFVTQNLKLAEPHFETELLERFPGFKDDSEVNGPDLVDFISQELGEPEHQGYQADSFDQELEEAGHKEAQSGFYFYLPIGDGIEEEAKLEKLQNALASHGIDFNDANFEHSSWIGEGDFEALKTKIAPVLEKFGIDVGKMEKESSQSEDEPEGAKLASFKRVAGLYWVAETKFARAVIQKVGKRFGFEGTLHAAGAGPSDPGIVFSDYTLAKTMRTATDGLELARKEAQERGWYEDQKGFARVYNDEIEGYVEENIAGKWGWMITGPVGAEVLATDECDTKELAQAACDEAAKENGHVAGSDQVESITGTPEGDITKRAQTNYALDLEPAGSITYQGHQVEFQVKYSDPAYPAGLFYAECPELGFHTGPGSRASVEQDMAAKIDAWRKRRDGKQAQSNDPVETAFLQAKEEEKLSGDADGTLQNAAFDAAQAAGWDWEADQEFMGYALKATPAEILDKGLEKYLLHKRKTGKSYGDVVGIEPAEKDIARMESMMAKADGDDQKVLQYAFAMANAITDSDKALRRGKAGEVVFGGALGDQVAKIFEDRAKALD